jgi:hypothetical protein
MPPFSLITLSKREIDLKIRQLHKKNIDDAE